MVEGFVPFLVISNEAEGAAEKSVPPSSVQSLPLKGKAFYFTPIDVYLLPPN